MKQDSTIDNLTKQNEELQEKNELLNRKIEKIEAEKLRASRIKIWLSKFGANIFLGWRLQRSVSKLFDELADGKIHRHTISNVITHTLWRITRIGLFAILGILLPTTILVVQLNLLSNQNKLLEYQNIKIEQQNQLLESQRRGSYVILMGNIMDAVNNELQDPINKERRISTELIGQIIAFSNSLLPYHFILSEELTQNPYSPERGVLLIFLLESRINNSDLNIILSQANFRNTYLTQLIWNRDTIYSLNMDGSRIDKFEIKGSHIEGFQCASCSIQELLIENQSRCVSTDFSYCHQLKKIVIDSSTVRGLRVGFAAIPNDLNSNYPYIEITHSTLDNIYLQGEYMFGLWLESSNFQFLDLNFPNIKYIVLENVNLRHGSIYKSRLIDWALENDHPFFRGGLGIGAPLIPSKVERLSFNESSIVGFEIRSQVYHMSAQNSFVTHTDVFNSHYDYYIQTSNITNSIIPFALITDSGMNRYNTFNIQNVKYIIKSDEDQKTKELMMDSIRILYNSFPQDTSLIDWEYYQ